ncbi:MAG TPA: DUF6541 family protein [Chloroflexota bacterium]|nr:DUF6541 family protein [Chloroflexota bacterium]
MTELPALTLAAGLPALPLVLAASALLFLPGYAAAAVLLPAPRYRPREQLLAAPALTLALLAVLTLWASVLSLPLGSAAALVLLAAAAAVVAVPAWRARPRDAKWPPAGSAPVLAYLGLFALALGLRLWSTRDVLPTLGADTYHHTLIAWLIVERGGLPSSYEPYAPIHSFAYHFGFHSLVAWLHWWTGAGVGELVSLAGHLVNVAVALGVAFFVLRVLGDGAVAGLAAWLVALLCVFPAYFANWGRFTQASGLLLLPVAAGLWIDLLRPALRPPKTANVAGALTPPPQAVVAGALAAAGLLLAHYRMAAVLALLLATWAGYAALRWAGASANFQGKRMGGEAPGGGPHPDSLPGGERIDDPRRETWRAALGLGGAALAALLLLTPWLVHLRGALSLGLGERAGDYGATYYGLERLGTAPDQPANLPLLLLAALGWALAWRGRAWPLLLLGGWAALQLALANPHWWPLPMPLAGRVDLVTVVAALCFPVAVAAAYALAAAWRAGRYRWPRAAPAGALALGLASALLGGWQLQRLVTPENALVTPADLAAAAWLRASTPPDARIAVRAVIFPWAPDYVVGVDGGYWLPLLAGRATTVLPMLYPGERGADPAATRAMVAVARALGEAPAAPETARLLRSLGVGYLYDSGRAAVPALDGLLASPAFRLVYERDGVRVLAVQPE